MRNPYRIGVLLLLLLLARGGEGMVAPTELPAIPPIDIYTRPLPEMPVWRDPAVINDTFTLHLYTQIHATLFRIDDKSQVRPYLVQDFSVSRDQLIYSLQLHPWVFHNGRAVDASDVKASLENAIRNHAVNFKSLWRIKGFNAFLSKKESGLLGIEILSPTRLNLRLTEPDPGLVSKLADLAYAIWDVKSRNLKNGLGPYWVVEDVPGRISLRLVPQRAPAVVPMKTPRQINFVRLSATDAIAQFKNGPVDDLFNYPVTRSLMDEIKDIAHVQSISFPRTYFLALNARTVGDRRLRRTLLDAADTNRIVSQCFPGEKLTKSLVPPGYWGHQDIPLSDAEIKPSNGLATHPRMKRKLRVAIVDSIGNESCLKQELRTNLSRKTQTEVDIVPLSKVVKSWPENKIDVIVAYMDAERATHYFGAFMPESDFPYGDPDDKAIPELFHLFDQASSPTEKNLFAQRLSSAILAAQTFRPLFHPEVFMVYKKRFKKLNDSFQATALLPINLFERE